MVGEERELHRGLQTLRGVGPAQDPLGRFRRKLRGPVAAQAPTMAGDGQVSQTIPTIRAALTPWMNRYQGLK